MSVEDLFKGLEPLPLDPAPEDIIERRKLLHSIRRRVEALSRRVKAEFNSLYALCDHKDSYSHNTWGRDPGGGGCNTCGKVW